MFWVTIGKGDNEVDTEEIYQQRVDDLDLWAVIEAVNNGVIKSQEDRQTANRITFELLLQKAIASHDSKELQRAEMEYYEAKLSNFSYPAYFRD